MLAAGSGEISSAHLISCWLPDTPELYPGYSGIISRSNFTGMQQKPKATFESPQRVQQNSLVWGSSNSPLLQGVAPQNKRDSAGSFRSPTYSQTRAKNNFHVQKTAKSKRNMGTSLQQKPGTALATGLEIVLTLKHKHLQRQFGTFKNTQHMV